MADDTATSISLLDLRDKNPEKEFNGFKDLVNFEACILSVSTFGILGIISASLPLTFSSFFVFLVILCCFTWCRVHGARLTRREHVFFDVRNLLEIAPNFEYESYKMSDDCMTPGEGFPQMENPGPQTIWEALFADENKIRMNTFYHEHYGPVYRNATKKYKEYEMQQKNECRTSIEPSSNDNSQQIKTARKEEN